MRYQQRGCGEIHAPDERNRTKQREQCVFPDGEVEIRFGHFAPHRFEEAFSVCELDLDHRAQIGLVLFEEKLGESRRRE